MKVKKNLCWYLATMFLLCLGQSTYGVDYYSGEYNINLVRNPGFEYYTVNGTYGDIPRDWYLTNWYGSHSTFGTGFGVNKKHGTYSLCIGDISSSAAAGLESGKIPVTPGYVYKASVWAKRSESFSDARASFYIRWYDSSNNCIDSTSTSTTNTGFTELVLTATAPVNADYARLLVYSPGDSVGVVYFDSVSFVLAEERINNGSFTSQTVGQIPQYWQVWGTHSGASQKVYDYSGDKVVKIVDVSTSETSGIYYKVPVSPGVPYQVDVAAKRVSGTGTAYVYLKFYDAAGKQIFSDSDSTTLSGWDWLAVYGVAPDNAAYGRVLFYSSTSSTGTFYFDDVSFKESYAEIYVSPSGTGSGLSETDPASATTNDQVWWTVGDFAGAGPVKVIFMEGTYSQGLYLHNFGNSTYQIVLDANSPFGTLFNDSDNPDYMIKLDSMTNVIVRHLHFTYDDSTNIGYCLKINDSSQIRIQGCSTVDAYRISFAFSGADNGSDDITWEMCSAVWMGFDTHAHGIYNNDSSTNLTINNCYFEDTAGAGVKFRDDCRYGDVEHCTFVYTGDYPVTYPNTHCVCISATNKNPNRQETLPYGITITDDEFRYLNPSEPGGCVPIIVAISGSSIAQPFYNIPIEDGDFIADVSQSAYYRNNRLASFCDYGSYYHFDIMAGDLVVDGIDGDGYNDIHCTFSRDDAPSGTWEGKADITALIGW
jgi:hypothetical protein